jgi:hypothetical protein
VFAACDVDELPAVEAIAAGFAGGQHLDTLIRRFAFAMN